MNVICIEESAFYEMIETVIQRWEEKKIQKNLWISPEEVMKLGALNSRYRRLYHHFTCQESN